MMMRRQRTRLQSASYFTILLFSIGLFLTPSVLRAQISGTVFRDFNGNGLYETGSSTYKETGLSNVSVKAFDTNGNQLGSTAITTAVGQYSISGVSGNVRIEFTLPQGYFASNGMSSNTSIQFTNAPNSSVNLGVNAPEDFWDNVNQPIPTYVIPCYNNGTATGPYKDNAAIVAIDDSQNGITGITEFSVATQEQVGSVWGMARDRKNDAFFATAFLKRHVGVGPAGFGGVYVVSKSGVQYALNGSFSLQGVVPSNSATAIDLGTVTRNAIVGDDNYLTHNISNPQSRDLDANGKIGKMSFGGAEYDEATRQLFIVNTFQKTLISIDVSAGATSLVGMTAAQLGAITKVYDISNLTACLGGSLRPWALHFRNGVGYLGTQCDAATSQSTADLSANIFTFNSSNPTTFTNILSLGFTYRLGEVWHAWTQDWSQTGLATADLSGVIYSEPLLSNIEFDENNNMLISIMNRAGHQLGLGNYYPLSGNTNSAIPITHGDLLKACYNSVSQTWVIEGTTGAGCGPNFTASYNTSSGYGNISGTQGEFFQDNSGDGGVETVMGSSTKVMGTCRLVTPVIDPWPATGTQGPDYYSTGGIHWYNVNDGTWNQHARIYELEWQQTFGKAEGLGDLEPNLMPQPIEIGNRVWTDTNKNGKQDAAEAGIDGVTVKLFEGATEVASIPTNNGGQYYFTNTNVTGGLKYNTAYEIRIVAAQTPLSTLSLTTTDVASNGSDLIDNDGSTSGANAIKAFTTGGAGENNHSYDFGFRPLSPDLTLTKTVSAATTTQGSNVIFTIKVKNEGLGNATGVTVHDTLPVGMTFISATPNGVYDANTKLWTVGNLNAGDSVTLAMTVRIDSVGVNYNTAEVHAMNETDTDSSPNNALTTEDDIARVCVSVPIPLCTTQGKTLTLTIPSGLTNIKWFKGGVEIAGQTANALIVSQVGDYTFTADQTSCPVEGCCPVKVVEGGCAAVCKPVICLPVAVVRQ